MSTTSNEKRLIDLTNDAATTKPRKKTKPTYKTKEKHWKTLKPYLQKTTKNNVENFAKNLFEELWKTSGEEAAKAVTASFVEKVDADTNKNKSIAGTWTNEEMGETFIVDKGIKSAYFSADGEVEVSNLKLQTSDASDVLVYKSKRYSWVGVPARNLTVTLRLTYHPEDDFIDGDLEIAPVPRSFKDNKIHFCVERKKA